MAVFQTASVVMFSGLQYFAKYFAKRNILQMKITAYFRMR